MIEEVVENDEEYKNTLDKYFNISKNLDEKSKTKVKTKRVPKIVYSYHDLKIANFLSLHNIKWEYSNEYKFNDNVVLFDFYLPEYDIYIEDEGLDKFGIPNNLKDTKLII